MPDSSMTGVVMTADPLWYKDAIIYEAPVKSFCDSVADGNGDFKGMTSKLDYLLDLGVTAIWILPFYPSPLRDDGYDIADYTVVHPQYGTLDDFKEMLAEAHKRGIRVITELVINHTSDQHPWFQRARRAPAGSPERDFYVWSDTPEKFKEARIIFTDSETSNWSYDPVAKAYFWHRFYSHQPDLNYDNPAVWDAIMPLLDYWLDMGVDGMRLDAIPYLYEREGTSCENLPETHAFLKALRKRADERHPGKMFLAEANQWPEDAVAYFGDGDECHTAFHFPLMPRMFMAIRTEDRFPIIDILGQTPAIPESCQWCLFLRNHDELTLEMVTDEERDYMYRAYASDKQARINLGIRRRLAPLLGNNRRRIELMNGLLFSLPGTPVLYYGDEIGMGDNIYLGDRNGVRTPMQWSGDRNAGFSKANPQKLYLPVVTDPEYHFEAVNVEAQQNNPNSLLWWMKRIIDLRKRYKAFGRGTIEFLLPENPKILAFVRRFEDETILVVANLSRFTQYTDLNLDAFAGMVPLELFGRVEFPVVTKDSPYPVMLAAHSFNWFSLQPQRPAVLGLTVMPTEFPEIANRGGWERLINGTAKPALEAILPAFLAQRRWFGGKNRKVVEVEIQEVVPVPVDGVTVYFTGLNVQYLDSDPELYILPLAAAHGAEAERVLAELPHAVVAKLTVDGPTVLYDAMWDPAFCGKLLGAMAEGQVFTGAEGKLHAIGLATLAEEVKEAQPAATLSKAEQSNTSIIYGDKYILKVFRRVEMGVNPDLEIGRFLTEKQHFPHSPQVLGYLEYRRRKGEPLTLAILMRLVPNQGTGWDYTLDALSQYLERGLSGTGPDVMPPETTQSFFEMSQEEPPPEVAALIGPFLESVRTLGKRTAEMHAALAADTTDPAFAAEPYSPTYQRSIYQSMRSEASRVLQTLGKRVKRLPDAPRELAQRVLDTQSELLGRFQAVIGTKMSGRRYRIHGDYHLGQVLHTGKDFVLIDFEGEPLRSLTDRQIKRSVLRDVAGMVRSFHYAAYTALLGRNAEASGGPPAVRAEDYAQLEAWCRYWYKWVAATFVRSYREAAGAASFVPDNDAEFKTMLDAFVLSKAVYELGYELGHRPDWVAVPLLGILDLIQAPPPAPTPAPTTPPTPAPPTA
jgi:maltose alpha-D-glucosyltransferase/alpha-amylase